MDRVLVWLLIFFSLLCDLDPDTAVSLGGI